MTNPKKNFNERGLRMTTHSTTGVVVLDGNYGTMRQVHARRYLGPDTDEFYLLEIDRRWRSLGKRISAGAKLYSETPGPRR